MFAKSNARRVFRYVISSFAVTCKACGRRVTTCRHNRMTKYAYWMMTHKYVPNDCRLEFAARKAGRRDVTAPIPKGFSKPWNAPLYDAPDIVSALERRKIPEGSEIGMPTPAADLSKNFDNMGNLPWETFLSSQKAEKRRNNAPSMQAEIPPKKWEQLTFAERKVELKKRAKDREVARQAKKLRQLRGEESSDSDSDDSDSSVARERRRKAEFAKKRPLQR